jgi:hypothetical protein
MSRLGKILLSLMLICPEIHGQSTYDYSRITMYSGLAWDLTTTVAIKAPEANPILGQHPVRQVAISTGLTVVSDLLTHYLQKQGHEKLATVFDFTVGSIHFGAGMWNLRTIPNSNQIGIQTPLPIFTPSERSGANRR